MLLTRNVTKALSILMVDFSCALKLAMPISVLAAIREANAHHITVKGGKFMEAVAEADTIVFDKTGTLTKAQPTVADVVSFQRRLRRKSAETGGLHGRTLPAFYGESGYGRCERTWPDT